MKKFILAAIAFLGISGAAAAQQTVNFPQVRNVPFGDTRTIVCGSGGPACTGNDPPVLTLSRANCGNPIALSNVRNNNGLVSANGVKAILPSSTVLAGKQCKLSFIFGTPSDNYLTIDPNGVGVTGAANNFNITTPFNVPYFPAQRLDLTYDTSTWKAAYSGSPSYQALAPFGAGQMVKHGDVKFFLVQPPASCPQWVTGTVYAASACVYNNHGMYTTSAGGTAGATPPTWVTGPLGPTTSSDGGVSWTFTKYFLGGDVAACPWNGNGLITGGSNSPTRTNYFADEFLNQLPGSCIYHDPTSDAGNSTNMAEVVLNSSNNTCSSVSSNCAGGVGDGITRGNPNGVGASVTASFATNVMTVTAVASGTIQVGYYVTAAGVDPATYVTGQTSGSTGGTGTYTLSTSPGTIAGEAATVYGAYVRMVFQTAPDLGPQNQVMIFSGAMSGLTAIPAEGIIRLVHTSAVNPSEPNPCAVAEGVCYDIIQPTVNGNLIPNAVTTYIGGDVQTSAWHIWYNRLNHENITIGHTTDPVTGQEVSNSNFLASIVGLFKLNGGSPNSVTDSESARNVSSWFWRTPKKLRCAYTTDRTETNTTPHETNTEIRCPFVRAGVPGTAQAQGAFPPALEFGYDGAASNGTAGDGCQSSVAFFATPTLGAAEVGSGIFINNANTNGAYLNIGFTGGKTTLTEGAYSITLVNNVITGGTCTFRADGSSLFAYPWQ